MKRSFFQAAVTSILLYGCTTWTLTKRLEKKLDGNYTRMLRAILNKSWQQHPTRHQLYGHLPPITKSIQIRRTRHAGHCWRSRDELIRDVLLWIPTHGRAKAGRPARTYIQQLCEDTGCCPEDLPRAMNDREEWRERVRDIRAASTIWWWWWWWFFPLSSLRFILLFYSFVQLSFFLLTSLLFILFFLSFFLLPFDFSPIHFILSFFLLPFDISPIHPILSFFLSASLWLLSYSSYSFFLSFFLSFCFPLTSLLFILFFLSFFLLPFDISPIHPILSFFLSFFSPLLHIIFSFFPNADKMQN